MRNFALASGTLLQREVVRFLRQRHRIIGALGTPLVFWLLIGSGMGRSFKAASAGALAESHYLLYFFPGTAALILLFTAIFSTISVIEDRHEGFLQGVLVAPVSRVAIALGKILGGTVLATGQGALLLAIAPVIGIDLSAARAGALLGVMFVMAFGLTGLGFVLAWRLDSTQGYHAIMNLLLMPMWFLSGALFPLEGAPGWLRAAMMANPLTYSVTALHRGFFGWDVPSSLPSVSTAACVGVTVLFAAAMLALAAWVTARENR